MRGGAVGEGEGRVGEEGVREGGEEEEEEGGGLKEDAGHGDGGLSCVTGSCMY